jgi:hypothetical protein
MSPPGRYRNLPGSDEPSSSVILSGTVNTVEAGAAPAKPQGRRQTALAAGVALVVFAGRCFWVQRAGAQLPIWDQWFANFANMYEPLLRDALPLHALAFAHNEHRVFTTRLTSLLLFSMSGYWDVKGEIVVAAAARGAEMALLVLLLVPLVDARRRLGLVALVLAVGALPLSPYDLLSGLPVHFSMVEIFSFLALALIAKPLGVARLCAVVVCLLLAFLSMATAILAMTAGIVILLAQALAGRSLPRPRGAVAALLLCLAAFALLLTPRYAQYDTPSAIESLRILVRCLTFPFPAASGWTVIGHLPIAILAFRLLRARAPGDPAWIAVALATWVLMQIASLAIGRGGTSTPGEQHLELLALPLIWNYVALARLVDTTAWPGTVSRLVRTTPALWALAACLSLAGHAWTRSVPKLRQMEVVRPLAEARFRQSLRAHNFGRELAEAQLADARISARDNSFLYDPVGRFTIPRFALPYLESRERPIARLFPPALSGIGRPALFARLLDGAAAAWPLALAIGFGLVFLGLRRSSAPHAGDPGNAAPT